MITTITETTTTTTTIKTKTTKLKQQQSNTNNKSQVLMTWFGPSFEARFLDQQQQQYITYH